MPSFRAISLVLCSLSLAACTISLKDVPLAGEPAARVGSARVAPTAGGIEGRVGWGRVTLFSIPAVPIFVVDGTKPGSENTRAQIANRAVMKQVRRALVHAGYEVVDASAAGAAGRVVECNVERFKFNNYTWLAPIVPAWGSASVTLSVRDESGAALWTQTFEGKGFSLNPFDGFSGAANQSMRKVLNAMVPALASAEFRTAIGG
jgi:hypothetical protein